jgi:CBS domain containing-hemolysin-like protein
MREAFHVDRLSLLLARIIEILYDSAMTCIPLSAKLAEAMRRLFLEMRNQRNLDTQLLTLHLEAALY